MKEKKLVVYVAGKYTAGTDEEIQANLQVAEDVAKKLFTFGFAPVIPHKLTAFWDRNPRFSTMSHGDWLVEFCYPLQDVCDMLFLCPGWKESKGACLEHEHAHETRQPHAETYEHLCNLRIRILRVEALEDKLRGEE
jgi:hypothetical protein